MLGTTQLPAPGLGNCVSNQDIQAQQQGHSSLQVSPSAVSQCSLQKGLNSTPALHLLFSQWFGIFLCTAHAVLALLSADKQLRAEGQVRNGQSRGWCYPRALWISASGPVVTGHPDEPLFLFNLELWSTPGLYDVPGQPSKKTNFRFINLTYALTNYLHLSTKISIGNSTFLSYSTVSSNFLLHVLFQVFFSSKTTTLFPSQLHSVPNGDRIKFTKWFYPNYKPFS